MNSRLPVRPHLASATAVSVWLVAVVMASVVALPGVAFAKVTLLEAGPFTWTLGGYGRLLAGVQVPNAEVPPEAPDVIKDSLSDDPSGLSAAVLRLEWGFKFGDVARLEVHNRFSMIGSSQATPDSGGRGIGIGTTLAPDRSLDTTSVIFSDDVFRLDHDLDRLVLRLFFDDVELSIGRQAVTWGTSLMFTVADVWAAFSPFDLDTSQKRGIDAVRAVVNLGSAELDILIADRGSIDALSGGIRATFYTEVADVYLGAGKFWEDVGIVAGIAAPVDAVKLRLEAMAAYSLDEKRFRLPRITAGVDWLASATLTLAAELHYNGLGTDEPDTYLTQFATPPVARGQTYLVGRYYAGLLAALQAHELVNLTLSGMMNLADPSALVSWSVAYSVTQDVDLSLGGFHGVGEGLSFELAALSPQFSELGAYGHLVYLQLSAFF